MTSSHHGITNRQLGAWHRRLGLAAAVILTLLVGSGLLLNHSPRLGLAQKYVQSAWLLDWYGIPSPGEPHGTALGGHWLSELGERVYLDARQLPDVRGRLHGAVLVRDGIAASVGDDIWLLTPAGHVIERLGKAHGVPDTIRALGVDQAGRLMVQTPDGVYAANSDLSAWHRVTPRAVSWGRPGAVPAALQRELLRQYRGHGLSVERVLVDLHSGRIVGAIGVWIVDIVALCCLGLAISGLWLWARRRKNEPDTAPLQGG